MTCKCGSNKIVDINAKCGDMCFTSFTGEHGERLEREGYAPEIVGIGGGDYIELSFCADCGVIQKFKPLTEKEVRLAIKGDEEEEEYTKGRMCIDKNSILDKNGYFKKSYF